MSGVDQTRNYFLEQIAAAIAGSGSGIIQANTSTKTAATYTIASTDFMIRCNCAGNAITVTLPAVATSTGRIIAVKKTDSSGNAVTISGDANIEGAATCSLPSQYVCVWLQSNGTTWDIIV